MLTLPVWRSPFDFLPNADSSIYNPVVHALGDGSFVTLWSRNETAVPGQLWMRVFKADGTPKGDPVEIKLQNEVTSAGKFEPAITVLNNGNFVVAREDHSTLDGESGPGLRGQVFDPNGGKVGTDFHINSVRDGLQVTVSLTALANGGFAVARPGEDPRSLEDVIANAITAGAQMVPDTIALTGAVTSSFSKTTVNLRTIRTRPCVDASSTRMEHLHRSRIS
jgi:hypothetical protein